MYYYFNGDTATIDHHLSSAMLCPENTYLYVQSPFNAEAHQWYIRPDSARYVPINERDVPEKHRVQLLLLL